MAKPITPAADQVGTLEQQLLAISEYLDDPLRHIDREAAWQAARARAMPNANQPVGDYAHG